MDDSHDDFRPAFPKPKKREKKPWKGEKKPWKREKKPWKGVNEVRPEGKRNYTTDQRARRRAEDTLYRRHSRPDYLMDLARRQGRLGRTPEDIPGDVPQEKLHHLTPDELPLCEAGAPGTGCDKNLPALHVHHMKGRGLNLNNPGTYLGVCPTCHDHIENNRAFAREKGWLESRNQVEQDDDKAPL